MAGTTPFGSLGSSSVFKKNPAAAKADAAAVAEVPQVPVERVVSSPRRQTGRGRRDTILTGSDGLQ